MKGIMGYRLNTERGKEFNHVRIQLVENDNFNRGYINFSWQQNTGESEWYAGSFEVTGNKKETLQKALKVLNKIGYIYNMKPKKFIELIEAELKIYQIEYHSGNYEFYTEKDFPQGKTYLAYTNKSNLFTINADNEKEAIQKAIKKAGKEISKGGHNEYIQWLTEKNIRQIAEEQIFPENEFKITEEKIQEKKIS